MNIFISESSMGVGGQEFAVLLHAEGLVKRGYKLRLILEPGSAIAKLAGEKKLPVTLMSMKRARYPQAIIGLRKLILHHRPAILQVNSSRDSWIGCIASRLVGSRPKIIRIRHISVPLKRSLTTQLLYRRLLDFVIVTGGERTRCGLVDRDGLDPHRVAAFPIGIDVGYFRPAPPERDLRQELGFPGGYHLVGLISYLHTYKGHKYFVEAAERVLTQHQDVIFLVVGDGPEEAAIRAHIESRGLAGHVRMLGGRYGEDLLNVFRSLDIFVIPSVEGDTIPQVLMQAMAMGIPVVSTTVGSIPDVVIEGETGFVVPPRDAIALADRILLLLGDARLQARIGANGRILVEGSYSIDKMLDRLEEVYQSVIQARRR